MMDFDDGWRLGMFDKCNGRPFALDTDWPPRYAEGYCHGYHSNERRI